MAENSCFDWFCMRVKSIFRVKSNSKKEDPKEDICADNSEMSIQTEEETTNNVKDESFFEFREEEEGQIRGPWPKRKFSAPVDPEDHFGSDEDQEGEEEFDSEGEDHRKHTTTDEPTNTSFQVKSPDRSRERDVFEEYNARRGGRIEDEDFSSSSAIKMQEMILKSIEEKNKLNGLPQADQFGLRKPKAIIANESGLNQRQLDSIYTNTFFKSKIKSNDPSKLECNICCTEFEEGSQIKILQCLHTYHQRCVDQWLTKRSTCPDCNFNQRVSNFDQLT